MITLTDLPNASANEVFIQASHHLLRQQTKSTIQLNNGPVCIYRHPTGLACPIGQFMTNSQFQHISNMGLATKPWRILANLNLAPKTHIDLLSDLQILHDQFDVSIWPQMLLYMSRQLNLPNPIL